MPPNTLKQRLAALSLASSSPTAPYTSDAQLRSPISVNKRRPLFTTPWSKRQPNRGLSEEQQAQDRVQDVMGKVVFQAGVDFETRPMVVFNASALPDPREVSYDLLLACILSYLNLYVESDYTVIFFAAGGGYTPGWNWIWKAYRSLSRSYRKNLKRLYIVHSSFFSKMLFSLAGAVISPKFFRKLLYTNTLSELACHVPLTQIDIPPAIYQENLKHEKEIVMPVLSHSNVFGVPLEELMGYDGEKGGVPRVVKDCIQFLRDRGLEEEGLFRRSPSTMLLNQAKEAYDRGQVISLESFGDPHIAAVLLKKYLRDLPEPLFPENLYPVIRRCPQPTDDASDISSIIYIRDSILTELAPCVYILLSQILHLLHDVSLRAATNLMDAHNLALMLCPNLISGSNGLRDVSMCTIPGGPVMSELACPTPLIRNEGKTTLGMVIKLCIQRYYEVFDDVRDRSEAVPPQQSALGESAGSEISSTSGSLHEIEEVQNDDDDDIDDAVLVMPIGPDRNAETSSPSQIALETSAITYKPRQRGGRSKSDARSMHSIVGESRSARRNSNGMGSLVYPSMNKAKSLISIEHGGAGAAGRKGSISVGRGTKKSSGAGVEAISITAEGFFTPPSSVPPVPPLPKS